MMTIIFLFDKSSRTFLNEIYVCIQIAKQFEAISQSVAFQSLIDDIFNLWLLFQLGLLETMLPI